MPIRSRGELSDPSITAIRDQYTQHQSLNIDTDVCIDISMVNTPDCQIYFTTDGSVPAPFKRYIGGREVTFRYRAPFALKSGRRVVRAVAVTRDGLLSSRVVSKTFIVHGDDYDTYDAYDSSDTFVDQDWSDSRWETTDSETDRGRQRQRRKWTTCRSWHDEGGNMRRTRPVSADGGWIASTRRYPYNVETLGEETTGPTTYWSAVDLDRGQREMGTGRVVGIRGIRFRTAPSIRSTTPACRSTFGGDHLRASGPRLLPPTPPLPPPPPPSVVWIPTLVWPRRRLGSAGPRTPYSLDF